MPIMIKALYSFLICFLTITVSKGQTITTIVGTGTPGYSGDGGQATAAQLNMAHGIDVDGAGTIYIADHHNNVIRKVSTSGIITTVAGTGVAGYSGDGGAATAAAMNAPFDVKADGLGNVFFADALNHRIRKISPGGIITTIAGTGTAGFSGDGGAATAATLNTPAGITMDVSGNIYFADCFNQRVRKIAAGTGIITTVAGTGVTGFSGDGGPATSAQLWIPNFLYMDPSGNLFISDNQNKCIRKVTVSGIISTFAGTGGFGGYGGDGGPATAAQLAYPGQVTRDAAGNYFIADHANNVIRKVDPAGIISTYAGTGVGSYGGDGGPAAAAQLNMPTDLAMRGGDLLICDFSNSRIRSVSGPGNMPPSFTRGASATLDICVTETARPVDTFLGIIDPNAGQTETWSIATLPSHGTLTGTSSAVSTAITQYPTGFSYLPTLSYIGPDLFRIAVNDGTLADTITINVNVQSLPYAGIISGIDSVCPGQSVTLSETVSGGIWSTSSFTISNITHGGIATGLAPGRDTIIYTVMNSCGIVSAIFPFRVGSYEDCHTNVREPAGFTNQHIRIYPNPAYDKIIISSDSELKTVGVYNITGQAMSTAESSGNNEKHISVSHLPPGVYFIKVDGDFVARFVKQ